MCLAQGPQRSNAGETRTRGLSVSSQALYHRATALPNTHVRSSIYMMNHITSSVSVQCMNSFVYEHAGAGFFLLLCFHFVFFFRSSSSFSLFSSQFYAYLCMTYTKITDNSYRYYQNNAGKMILSFFYLFPFFKVDIYLKLSNIVKFIYLLIVVINLNA